jgi:hypothetical protein
MRKAIAATLLASGLLVTSVTAAFAWDERFYDGYGPGRGPGPVAGFLGQIADGAITIATAPLQLVGVRNWGSGWLGGPGDYYIEGAYAPTPEIARDYYGTGARFYGPPPLYAHDHW